VLAGFVRNAHLVAPGLRVNIEGKPNQFKRLGRPRSLFAPKSSRIARWLLVEPARAFSQRELAKANGLDEGFTSRIVRQLEEQRLVSRDSAGAVKVADYDALLDAWREAYGLFETPHRTRHIAARSSDEILRRVSAQLKRGKLEHARRAWRGRGCSTNLPAFGSWFSTWGKCHPPKHSRGWVFTRKHEARTSGWSCQTTKACSRRGGTRRHPLCSSGASVFGSERSSRAFRRSRPGVAQKPFETNPCLKNQRPPPVIRPTRLCG